MNFNSADVAKTRTDRHQTVRLHVELKKRYTKLEKEDFLLQGVSYVNAEKYDKAIEIFKLMPNYSYSQYNMGLCYLKKQQYETANACFLNALKKKNWTGCKESEEAKTYCREKLAGAMNPDVQEFLIGEGCQLLDEGKHEEAYRVFLRLPKHGMTEYNLALCASQLGRVEESLMHYRNVVEANLSWNKCLNVTALKNNALYNSGLIKMEQAKNAEGEEKKALFNEARQLFLRCKQPYTGFVLNQIGITYELEGNLEEAIKNYKRAREFGSWPGQTYYETYNLSKNIGLKIAELESMVILSRSSL